MNTTALLFATVLLLVSAVTVLTDQKIDSNNTKEKKINEESKERFWGGPDNKHCYDNGFGQIFFDAKNQGYKECNEKTCHPNGTNESFPESNCHMCCGCSRKETKISIIERIIPEKNVWTAIGPWLVGAMAIIIVVLLIVIVFLYFKLKRPRYMEDETGENGSSPPRINVHNTVITMPHDTDSGIVDTQNAISPEGTPLIQNDTHPQSDVIDYAIGSHSV